MKVKTAEEINDALFDLIPKKKQEYIDVSEARADRWGKDFDDFHREDSKRWIDVDDLLKYLETNFVMPFEGVIQSKSIGEINLYNKIINYNREKFNKLKIKLTQTQDIENG